MKNSFLIILTMLVYTTADAQIVMQRDWRADVMFGVKAGVNSSNVWDKQDQNFRADSKVGFVGGGFIGIPISKYLGIQPEVLFSQKGFKAEGTIVNAPYSLNRTTSHIDVPIYFQYKPLEFVTVLGGPVYSYLLSQKDELTGSNNAVLQEQVFKDDNTRKSRLGLMFGVDVAVPPFIIGGRAGWDFQSNQSDGSSSSPNYKNQWVQLTLGLKLSHSKYFSNYKKLRQ